MLRVSAGTQGDTVPPLRTANGHAAEAEALKPPPPLATKDVLHDIDLVVPKVTPRGTRNGDNV